MASEISEVCLLGLQRPSFQGCHRQGKQNLFKVRKKSGNFGLSQGISKFYFKVIEKSGNFIFASQQVWERVFLLAKVVLFQKTFTKELISVVSLLVLLVENCLLWTLKTGLWSLKSREVLLLW